MRLSWLENAYSCPLFLWAILTRKYKSMCAAEHVSGASFPLTAQTYFCDSRSQLRFPLRGVPLPLQPIFSHPLTAPLPLTRFFARSAPAPLLLRYVSSSKLKKWTDFYRESSYHSAVLGQLS